MRKMAGVAALLWVLYVPSAYAWDWKTLPLVGQVYQVGSCVLADSGKIVASAVTHGQAALNEAVEFGTDTLKVVSDCIVFVVDQVTPGSLTSETHT